MPSLDPNLPPPRRSAAALREFAAHYWHLAGLEPDPSLNRMRAMFFHTEAIKLEAGFADDLP